MWRIIACAILLGYSTFICCANENPGKKGEGPPCGKNSTQSTGGFHLNINNFTGVCVWNIAPKLSNGTKATISLFIHFLYLQENDTVTLFKNETDVANDSLSLIEPLRVQNGSVTIITKESNLFIKFEGDPNVPYQRNFDGMFQGHVCAFPITPALQLIHSPIAANNMQEGIVCSYIYNKDPHFRTVPSFLFEKFEMTSSDVTLSQSTKDGPYKKNPAMDFFPISEHQPMKIDVTMTVPTNDSFILRMHMVDSECHVYKKIDGYEDKITVDTPADMLNNGSIIPECRWVFEHSDPTKILGVTFDKLHLDSTVDIIAINDGASELSTPLMQVTASSGNTTNNQLIRTTGPYLWMAFKPSTYASSVIATVTVHGQGGHFKGNGNITMEPDKKDDTAFLLEVEENQIVLLKFNEKGTDFPLPATLSIYDGFDKTNLLATLHGNVWYPVISTTSKMMIIATQFAKGSFKAEFSGASASCLHMGTFSNENYILSGNCNSSCLWVIPPQDQPNTNLLLNLQYLALGKDDAITVRKLDANKTVLGEISSSLNHVPQLMVPANIGALVEIARAPCAKGNTDIVVVGHSSYLPACGSELSPQAEFQISSPLHPDTYPIYASCQWKISAAKDNLVHLAFHSLKLAPNHCVKIKQSSDNKTEQYVGSDLRGDLFLTGEAVVEFDSRNCIKPKEALSLVSSEGFVLNGTVSDCGSVLSGKASGTFTVLENKPLCIWKVSIPETGHDTSDVVNVISYTVSKNDDKGNYELLVYDGDSIRDPKIVNDTKSDIWSRTSNLIFVYKRIDAGKPSTIVTIKYQSISCNSTMQCDNKVCLHPDWRCNGVNNCGDFTDERNCNAVPVPPITELKGYSSTAFWVTITIMLALGAALGFGVPICYQKYKNGQYRRFGEISIIE